MNTSARLAIDQFIKDEWFTWDYWVASSGVLLTKVIVILLIIAAAWIVLRLRKRVIKQIFRMTKINPRQEKTLESLLFSVTRYIIYFVAALMILDLVGIAIGPIIAGAGVLGLAIGFGAQTLVKDLITGFFIIFEDQFSVGDYVSINNGIINGTITSVGLRATTIRTRAQHVVYIQNSAITMSQNYNRERMRVLVDIPLPLNTNLDLLEEVVNQVSTEMVAKMPEMFIVDADGVPVEPPQLENIGSSTDNSLKGMYTVSCLVKDQYFWQANRELRKDLTQALFMKGIALS